MPHALFGLVLIVVCAATPGVAAAQSADGYPAQPIRFIVPYSPGGGTDTIARLIAQPLAEASRQPVVVDNRPGASGMIGSEAVLKAPADGYTMVLATLSTMSLAPLMQSKVRYDPQKDFAPVTLIATFAYGLVAHPSLPAKSVPQLVALARAGPGKITVGSAGLGTATHLAAEYFSNVAGIKFTHVPYKSDGQAVPALLGGEVTMGMFTLITTTQHIRTGRLRALVVTSAARVKELPEVPTVAESGYPGFEAVTWHGVAVRAGTPPDIVRKLNSEIVRILKSEEFRSRLPDPSAVIVANTPEEFERFILSENAKWKKVIASAAIRID
jgi:tripartite-type tricarboxylate transporter receptor subunit TctC